MNQNIKTNAGNESNLLTLIAFRFLPYWPLLILFGTICFIGAMAYMKISLPAYEANAILLVKDEKKGSDDSRMIDALNVYHSKKIVENEIEVIQSRQLMKEVVKTLGLYAPVSMDTRIRSVSAYTTTPVAIRVKNPENLVETEKVYFTYDSIHQSVKIGSAQYSINSWVKTPYGDLMFVPNTRLKTVTRNPLFFSLVPTKKVVMDHVKSLSVSAANKMSSVVTLTFVDEVPVRAEDILNELIRAYDLAGINDKNALADNTMQFVDERLKHVKVEIDSIEKEIQLYRSGQGAVNLSEQSSVFLRNV
ncbi:MAG: capsular biosynthesis protein, partial [Cytophagales bacterium]|nr:capsular biosynthesis protein [Cytophaga sp.]